MNENPGESLTPQDPADTRAESASIETPQAASPDPITTGEARESASEFSRSRQPQEAATHTRQPAESKPDPRNLRPKTGPIVWGVLVLAFCVYTASQTVAPGSVNGTTFVIAATITLGVLLLAIGAAVIVRSSKAQRR